MEEVELILSRILEILSTRAQTFTDLCHELQEIYGPDNYTLDEIEEVVQNALQLGQSLGVITILNPDTQVPFALERTVFEAASLYKVGNRTAFSDYATRRNPTKLKPLNSVRLSRVNDNVLKNNPNEEGSTISLNLSINCNSNPELACPSTSSLSGLLRMNENGSQTRLDNTNANTSCEINNIDTNDENCTEKLPSALTSDVGNPENCERSSSDRPTGTVTTGELRTDKHEFTSFIAVDKNQQTSNEEYIPPIFSEHNVDRTVSDNPTEIIIEYSSNKNES